MLEFSGYCTRLSHEEGKKKVEPTAIYLSLIYSPLSLPDPITFMFNIKGMVKHIHLPFYCVFVVCICRQDLLFLFVLLKDSE